MILIVSHKEDYTTDYLVNILNKRKVNYLRLNTDDIGVKHEITFLYNELNIIISVDGISDFHSVWFRRTKTPEIKFKNENENLFFLKDYKAFLNNLWTSINAKKWISNPNAIIKAENKLHQLKLAKRIGFQIPKTIVSNDKRKIGLFYEDCNEEIIVKPLYGGRYFDNGKTKLVFTNKVKKKHIFNIENFVFFPMIFQEEIKKEYEIRVTIVGRELFAAKVDSQSNNTTKLDWRKDRIKFTKYDLPNDVSSKCIELVNILELQFGAIDLIKTNEGYVFLEINANGQWVWIENDTGLKISDAIINYLTN